MRELAVKSPERAFHTDSMREWGSWEEICACYKHPVSCLLFGCSPCTCGLTACYAKNRIARMIGGEEAEDAGSYFSQCKQCCSSIPYAFLAASGITSLGAPFKLAFLAVGGIGHGCTYCLCPAEMIHNCKPHLLHNTLTL